MSKRRTSLTSAQEDDDNDPRKHEGHAKMDQGEMKFNYKQQKLQTDLEMWVMDEVPGVFGVDDSDELREELQEDGQAELVEKVCHAKDIDAMRTMITEWLGPEASGSAKDDFVGRFVSLALKVQLAGKKK
uniref:Uncharacterized protein n=1 Tax=Alexandrium andersonii TaxID=327968 RepID=A0A7S2CJ78_9DINO|mmetsp:Transcript_39393/g.89556  ORF Transcript_39393/g.89556 Transcript_39393/m.89556 type:complete len:130 (+) Transcript_39393:140-529(+)